MEEINETRILSLASPHGRLYFCHRSVFALWDFRTPQINSCNYNVQNFALFIRPFFPKIHNRFCGIEVRLPGCRHKGPGYDSKPCQIF
jgi:hypothetical protein